MRILHLIVAAVFALPLLAGEYAVLGNGSRLHDDRHEVDGSVVRLYSGSGTTEIPVSLITGFEAEEFVPTPPKVEASEGAMVRPVAQADVPDGAVPQDLAAAAARKYALPSSFVKSVMRAESGFQQKALSPKGAIGLMQLMPETARKLGVDPKNARQNAEGGAQYLHELLEKYEDNPDQVLLALAAYNAGPAAVDKYHGVPPYRETHDYILRILKDWNSRQNAR